jgi:very-short-patch-repair endonuclease
MSDLRGTVQHMGRNALFDGRALADVVTRQNGVISRGQAQLCGLSDQALRHRIREGGPWQVVLPGVYLTSTGIPTGLERLSAALIYAGPGSAITGPAALALHRIRAPQTRVVDVLIPHERRRRSLAFVRVHRTSRMPDVVLLLGEASYVPAPRAVADTVRGLRDIGAVRAVVADGVQRGKVQVAELADELASGPFQGSARFRQVLEEVAEGVRSAAEGDLRSLIKRERLPGPLYNPRLYVGHSFIARPDAWWPDAGVAVEIESRQWHLSPGAWERTLSRDARMSARGIIVLHFPPRRLRTESGKVAGEIRSALDAGRRRGGLDIRAVAC